MAVQTIAWRAPKPTDGTGMPVPEGSDVPVFKGAIRSDREMVKMLDEVLDDLSGCPCCFWACRGPKRPIAMCTCRKCWAMREVAKVRAALNRRAAVPSHNEGAR